MNVKLDDNFKITSDARNFILERKKINGDDHKYPGEESWVAVGFYPCIDSLLRGWYKQSLLQGDIDSLKDLTQALHTLTDLLVEVRDMISGTNTSDM